jgi:acyl transferase domain-containing protein/NAD(P)-dependent dehydrogenase (short-subunit alcohol dehydrogenase family)
MKEDSCPVAIVGMSCFFPKSSGLKAYWRLLRTGQDAITEVPSTHWLKQDYFDPDPRTPDRVYCTRGGFIPPVEFDPSEFGIPPSSLEATDSSQLLALAAAKQALEDMGSPYDPSRTSVILGVTGTQELVIPLSSRLGFPKWRQALEEAGIDPGRSEQIIRRISDSYVSWQENSFPGLLGNVVAGRISNRLDLGGTNCVVDAACASSFAALHLALLELISGRSDLVITGGVDTLNDIFMHMCFAKTQILSPTGDARPFSTNADGTVLGEGVGMLVLKRLDDAERDRNRIYAVIRGIGSASDGRSQSIYAPRVEGQVKALENAYAAAGIDPATVGLVEAHGTGTRIGDKVEFQALCQVLGEKAADGRRIALGSVKSMIGHTKAAAGAAGLVKTVLALYHKVLPPTLKADEADPALNIESSPLYLNTRTRPWVAPVGHPRRAGVSAFGFGGSNFHLVLEEHRTEKPQIAWDGSIEILAFSADTRPDLSRTAGECLDRLESPLSDSAFAAIAAGTRTRFDCRHGFRLLLTGKDPQAVSADLRRALAAIGPLREDETLELAGIYYGGPADRGRLAFLFPGQGSQYPDMGRDLVCTFPQAMAVLEHAERRCRCVPTLSGLVFPRPETDGAEAALQSTAAAQPAIGAISLAMLRVVEAFGLAPDAVAGHSFGELTALCAAGWIGEGDFFDLAAARGAAMAAAEPGGMLAVHAPLGELDALLARNDLRVTLANRNGPAQGVLSGTRAAVAEAARLCRASGYPVKDLPVGGAFHSPLMEKTRGAFLKQLQDVGIGPSRLPVFSNTMAGPYPQDAAKARQLLADHMLRPVDFVGEIEAMYHAGVRTFVEVGPRSVLTGLVGAILKGRPFQALALDASGGRQSGLADLAKALCRLAAGGFRVRLENWESAEPAAPEPRMRVPISGANYRHARPGIAPRPNRQPAVEPVPAAQPPQTSKLFTIDKEAMSRKNSPFTDSVTEALRSVQEGLKTIQAIQIQTAQAHQKFLESQSEASRILLEIVKSTGRLAGIPIAAHEETQPTAPIRLDPPQNRMLSDAVHSAEPGASLPAAPAEPPAVELPTAPPSPGPAASGAASPAVADAPREHLTSALLEVVSALTGYPVDMLGLDMDIEADLGIDSIKRVEILSALEEKMPGLPPVAPEDMGRLKTLGQIIEHFSGARPAADALRPLPALPPAAPEQLPALAGVTPAEPTDTRLAARQIVAMTPAPAIESAAAAVPENRTVFITDDRTGLAQAVLAEFGRMSIHAVLVSVDILKFKRDLPRAAGLVIIQNPKSPSLEADLKHAFELTRAMAADLLESAKLQGAFFATVTRMDGAFGFGGRAPANPMQGALAGLAKTAAAEWPEVICHALDIDPAWTDPHETAKALIREIVNRGPVEIGMAPGSRSTPVLVPQDYPEGDIPLQAGDAVVISGGGRGITAACAVELARRVRPALVLLGRSPEPVPEPEWMRGLEGEADVKKALLQMEFEGTSAKPAAVERRLRQLLANREVSRTLDAIRAAGAAVAYYAVDVRNAGQVEAAIADARARSGPSAG